MPPHFEPVAIGSTYTNRGYAALGVIGLILVYTLARVVYLIFFHPLHNVPGPLFAKITTRYLTPAAIRKARCYKLRELHDAYGPVVRVGINEVSLSKPDMYRSIYTNRTTAKAPDFYVPFEFIGQGNMFSEVDPAKHASHKKAVMPFFAQQHMISRTDLLLEKADHLIHRILKQAYASPTKTVEVCEPLGLWSLEVICKVIFNCEMLPDDERSMQIMKAMEGSPPTFILNQVFPIINKLGIGPSLPGAAGRAYRHFNRWRDDTMELLSEFQKGESGLEEKRKYIAGGLLYATEKTRSYTFEEAVEEIMGIEVAGSQVTQHTLMYLLYEIARPRGHHIQNKLRKELEGVEDTIANLTSLPYLTAVIKETYRSRPAIMSTLPRILTQPLVVSNSEITLPPGTRIGMQNWVHHRDPELFPQADDFIPERWLEGHELNRGRSLKEMNDALTPYSLGAGSCLGQNLAKVQLHLTVARLVRRLDFTLNSTMTEDDIHMEDLWATHPKAEKLLLDIHPLRG